jgi:hypothetical protein
MEEIMDGLDMKERMAPRRTKERRLVAAWIATLVPQQWRYPGWDEAPACATPMFNHTVSFCKRKIA